VNDTSTNAVTMNLNNIVGVTVEHEHSEREIYIAGFCLISL